MGGKKSVSFKIIISSAAVSVFVVIGIVISILHNREDSYRIIKVFSLDGNAVIKREKLGEIEAYKNMLLESGDIVSLDKGTMTLKLDEDKYIYVEEQTEFELEAAGNGKNSKTKIKLNKGAITNELQSKLNGESVYEINTQNSIMSVRGTIYRVEIYTDENGILYTRVTVFEGSVAVRLVYPDGRVAGEETTIDMGKEVIIYEDASTTDYLTGVRDIVYSELPDNVIELLQENGLIGNESGTTENPDETSENGITEDTGETTEDMNETTEDASGIIGDANATTEDTSETTEDANATTEDTSETTEDASATTEDASETTEDTSETTEDAKENFTVTFMYNGNVFGTQQVKNGECAAVPVLMPAPSGSWDFDFTVPVTEDMVIQWNM